MQQRATLSTELGYVFWFPEYGNNSLIWDLVETKFTLNIPDIPHELKVKPFFPIHELIIVMNVDNKTTFLISSGPQQLATVTITHM